MSAPPVVAVSSRRGGASAGWAPRRAEGQSNDEPRVRLRVRQLQTRHRYERALRQLGLAVYSEDTQRITEAEALAVQTGTRLERTHMGLRRTRADAGLRRP